VVAGAQVRDLSREYDKLHRVIESKEGQLENLLVLEHTNKQVSAHSPSTVSMLTGKRILTVALGQCKVRNRPSVHAGAGSARMAQRVFGP
jgi:hypothetical protein